MSDEEESPLDELMEKVDEAEEHGQELSQKQKRQQQIKESLRESVKYLEDEEVVSETEAEAVLRMIEESEYGQAREQIKEYKERSQLEFTAEEKNLFAEKFSGVLGKMDDDIENIKNSLLSLEKGVDRDDCINYLFGKHNKIRKSDLEAVFDVLEKIDKSGFSREEKARVIRAFDSDLNLEPTKEILKYIEQEADR